MASSNGSDRSSYVAAIIVNAALIYLMSNLLEWGLLPFLTNGFVDVRGWIIISLIVAIAFNVLFLAFDQAWFRSIGRIVMSGFSLAVSIIMYQKFPFDFTPYDFDWSLIARVLIVLAIGGSAIAILAELVKLARGERLAGR
jgi:hypothetical protein